MNKRNLVDAVLGGCHLIEPLGGPHSSVYRARQVSMDRDVAVETAANDVWRLKDFQVQYQLGAQLLGALEHQYIVPFFDYGVDKDVSYVIMRLLTGGTLADRIAQHPQGMDLAEASSLLLQISAGLHYVHQRGVLHYNVKPRSIIYDLHDAPYLTGFVIAKLMETFGGTPDDAMLFGTPEYMPPEQWRAETLSPRADQYALAVTAYEMVCGRPPFTHAASNRVMHMHLNVRPPDPRAFRPDLPEELAQVLLRGLAKDPAERYPGVGVFAAEFEKARATPETGYHVFISYSRADMALMHRVRDALVRAGFAVWTDEDLTPGAPSWELLVADAIENASALVVILSPEARRSEWIIRELTYADLQQVRVLPVLMQGDAGTAIPLRLVTTQLVDATQNFDAAMSHLTHAIRKPFK